MTLVDTKIGRCNGSFTPNDSVTVIITLMGGTFDLFDDHFDGQKGLHTHFARQRNVVAWCEQILRVQTVSITKSQLEYFHRRVNISVWEVNIFTVIEI